MDITPNCAICNLFDKLFAEKFAKRENSIIFASANAKVAQLVEHNLAKVRVAGSSPVFRSKCSLHSKMVCSDGGMVDTQDLKSCDH